jgi:hypothetical protein
MPSGWRDFNVYQVLSALQVGMQTGGVAPRSLKTLRSSGRNLVTTRICTFLLTLCSYRMYVRTRMG